VFAAVLMNWMRASGRTAVFPSASTGSNGTSTRGTNNKTISGGRGGGAGGGSVGTRPTAADLLQTISQRDLERLLQDYGNERHWLLAAQLVVSAFPFFAR
jgi:hypothetical protein